MASLVDLIAFPAHLKDLMMKRQQEAGNPPNFNVFLNDALVGAHKGGFDWGDTPEGSRFWSSIMVREGLSVVIFQDEKVYCPLLGRELYTVENTEQGYLIGGVLNLYKGFSLLPHDPSVVYAPTEANKQLLEQIFGGEFDAPTRTG